MASRMIGRTACPECGFSAAHVKESEKCIYRYCPECGTQCYAKTAFQRANLMAKTRLLEVATGSDSTATPTGPEKTAPAASVEALPTPTEPSPTPTPAKRRGLF